MGKINRKYETYTPGDLQNFAIHLIDKFICESKDENLGNESYCSELENKSVNLINLSGIKILQISIIKKMI